MEKITAFFEGIDLSKLVPQMDTLLEKLQLVASVVLMAGPVIMLAFGLWYFFLPPKEANHRAGFRTYFGMGSVEAWRFTQKVAGIAWGGMGLILTVVMGIICKGFAEKEVMQVADTAFRCLIWQAILALVGYLAVSVLAAVFYDSKGNRRRFKKK